MMIQRSADPTAVHEAQDSQGRAMMTVSDSRGGMQHAQLLGTSKSALNDLSLGYVWHL
jgi:hypothetical protein